MPEFCRQHGISSATFYKWRSKYGGMDASQMGRMKELEEENRRLKKMYAESQMSADILREAMQKMVRPSQRREMARWAVQARGATIRQACTDFSLSETAYRYRPKRSGEDVVIADWLVRLTFNQKNWGFGLYFGNAINRLILL